jgi:putative ABC transport system permease protein
MFAVVNSVLLRPLPYHDAARLTMISPVDRSGRHVGTALLDFQALTYRGRTFESLAAYYRRPANLTGMDQPERLRALVVTPGFLSVLRVTPALGRGFLPQEAEWGRHRVTLLSYAMWQRAFAGDPGILGRTVALDGDAYTIVGVLPRDFWFMDQRDPLLVPLAFAPGDSMATRSNHFLTWWVACARA